MECLGHHRHTLLDPFASGFSKVLHKVATRFLDSIILARHLLNPVAFMTIECTRVRTHLHSVAFAKNL
jgi:hypothetical protein